MREKNFFFEIKKKSETKKKTIPSCFCKLLLCELSRRECDYRTNKMLQRWAQVAKEAISSLTAQDPNRLFLRDQRDIENRGEPPLPAEDYYAIPHMSAQERIDAIHVQVRDPPVQSL